MFIAALFLSFALTVVSHIFGLLAALFWFGPLEGPARAAVVAGTAAAAMIAWAVFNVIPARVPGGMATRLGIMMGGRVLMHSSLAAILWNGVAYGIAAANDLWLPLPFWAHIADGLVAVILVSIPLINGGLRVFCLSRRLRILRRLAVLCTCWIPVLGVAAYLYLARIAYVENRYEQRKMELSAVRDETALCRTRYPLVMLHGIGFRDLEFFNYWGRIPRELERNGASVFYGNQPAAGSVEQNAAALRLMIESVLEESGCDKVNVIAHSKGGLDARYMISSLNMAGKVASLTTISSPHRGCPVADSVQKAPKGFYALIGRSLDRYCAMLGDRRPEFEVASLQSTTEYTDRFNRDNPDVPGVYYQSYASLMRFFFSDGLFLVPYIMTYATRGPNDGLVDVESAKWGDFRGVISTKGWRGVSHSDMIDLKREDFSGFDPAEAYVDIVSSLRERGF